MGNNTPKFQKTWDVSGKLSLISGETSDEWTGSVDVSNLTTSTNHKTGASSIIFDKSGTSIQVASITSILDKKTASLFSLDKLRMLINLSSLTDIALISLTVGTDAFNNNVYNVADTLLSTGWSEVTFDCDNPTSVNGTGIDWYNVAYVGVSVVFDAAGDTLTDILVDSIEFYKDPSAEWDHNVPESFVLTNVPNATPDETIIVSMKGYTGCSFHIEKRGTDTFAATIESSNEGIISTDHFIDTTTNGWTIAGGGLTADFIVHTKPNFRAMAHKLKFTTAGGNDDADFNVFVYRW